MGGSINDKTCKFKSRHQIFENHFFAIRHYGVSSNLIAPQHPASNGATENSVKTIKRALKKAMYGKASVDFEKVLHEFLFDYRTTTHCGTGYSPTERVFSFKPRTRLDLL